MAALERIGEVFGFKTTDARGLLLEALVEHFRTASVIAEKHVATGRETEDKSGHYQQGKADAFEEAERLCLTLMAMTRAGSSNQKPAAVVAQTNHAETDR